MQWPLEGRGLQLGRTFSLAIASSPVSPFLFPFFSLLLPHPYPSFSHSLFFIPSPSPYYSPHPPSLPLLSRLPLLYHSLLTHSTLILALPLLSPSPPPPSASVCKSHFLFSASHSLQRHGGVECECCPISLRLKEGRECSGGHDVRNDDDYDDGEHDRFWWSWLRWWWWWH